MPVQRTIPGPPFYRVLSIILLPQTLIVRYLVAAVRLAEFSRILFKALDKEMQVASNARRLANKILRPHPPILLYCSDHRFQTSHVEAVDDAPRNSLQWRNHGTLCLSGIIHENRIPSASHLARLTLLHSTCSIMMSASYSSGAGTIEGSPTEAVKELFDKMLNSVAEHRTMPPNASLWSLIENCANHNDIKLLFDILQHLRKFRLSNLRIHANFNCNLCREITKACAHVGAIDFGKKALWKHNVYGLTPSIGSAHHLLLYARQHNDAKLMVEIMKLLKRNDLPLQPGTADIVFSICYKTDSWELISKYSKKFVKAGVKLRQTSFDIWMEFAAKTGLLQETVDSLWKIEKLRSDSMKQHTLATGFSCTKGFLLERKPENAAAIIQVLNQTLSDAKRPGITVELQKLVSEWPLEVIKQSKRGGKEGICCRFTKGYPCYGRWHIKLRFRGECPYGRPNQK
ncbi:hypothetical protein F0562_000221 [Nyssa sinensis]|uniref:Uncharacterized protein n=1 Tax=Nyssa sinensis TaxID=561372 RepID=A0A5J5C3M3_9ASTE|nr:hypothetical protein F0562_000221 [Nyssa sinensis]